MTSTESRLGGQRATASGASVVIQVGRDLYVSDASLTAPWTPGGTVPGECPFPGLDAFGPGQAHWFFGRQTLTGELLDLLDTVARSASGGPVLVVGPSGAGKSSLLGAGLLAALAEGRLPVTGSANWPRLMLTPGAHPAAALREALSASAAMADGTPTRTVIVVDQMEEIFTACSDEAERADFLGELTELSAGPALVVLGLRADFYARATAYPLLRSAMGSRQIVLGAMSAAEVRQAITAPARAAGLTLDSGLAERLLHDLGADEGAAAKATGAYEAGRLPLLAHALRATWQRRDGDLLTIAGYEATGGIGGAIAKSAEQVYVGLGEDGQRTARQVFLTLVRVGEGAGEDGGGEGSADTRRRVGADRLYALAGDQDTARAVVSHYTAARLLTSGGDAVQISHEALLRSWPRLRSWISEDRASHLLRQDLEEAAATWNREGRDTAGLYGGVRLAAARAWADGTGRRELSTAAREFLIASDRRRRRGVRRRNVVIAVLAALSVALASVASFALVQRATARSAYNQAESELLSNAANSALANSDPGAAMQFALQAQRLEPTSAQARSALLSTQAQPFAGRLDVTSGDVLGVAYSPDGSLIAASTNKGTVQVWSASAQRLLASQQVLPGEERYLHEVAFSPDGRLLATTGPGGAWLYHVAASGRLTPDGVLGPGGVAGTTAEAFSPDGRTLALAIGQPNQTRQHVQEWNVAARTLAATFPVGPTVHKIAFAARGRLLVTATSPTAAGFTQNGPTAGSTQNVTVWDAATGHQTVSVRTVGAMGALAVSPDGTMLAFDTTAGSANVVNFWSITDHRGVGTLKGFSGEQDTLAFSPDGTLLATGGLDDATRLWDIATYPLKPMATFKGQAYPVVAVAFSPDGRTVASGGDDGTVVLWNVRGTTLGDRIDPSLAAAFSPDGGTLAVGTIGTEGTEGIALYAMPSRKLLAFLPTGGLISQLTFSPGGRTLAAAVGISSALPETVQLWDTASHARIGRIMPGQPGVMLGLAFSRDGLLATTAIEDSTVRVWSTARLAPVTTITATQHAVSSLVAKATNQRGVAFSPNGRLMAVAGSDGVTRMYSVPGYRLVDLYSEQTAARTVAFAPDGHTLAIGDVDGTVYLYAVRPVPSARPAQLLQPVAGMLSASSQPISGIAFTPDGTTLIAAGADGTIRLWNVPSQALTAVISTDTGVIDTLAYSHSQQLIVTGGLGGTHVWQTSPDLVASDVCRAARAPVSRGTLHRFLPGAPYAPPCG